MAGKKDEDMQEVLDKSFVQCQEELLDFAAKNKLDFDLSGTTATVLLRNEQKIHIAWVGDSCGMVASWNKNNSEEVFTTGAHLPEMEAEKKRINDTGNAEVRDNEGSWRIYLKGKNVPGLTMSR